VARETSPQLGPARVGDLRDMIRPARPLAPGDSVAKAVRLMRARGLPALPVAEGGRLIGMVHEVDLAGIAAEPEAGPATRTWPVIRIARPIDLIVGEHYLLRGLGPRLAEPHSEAVPVIGADGRYLGLLLRRDILAALYGEPLVPPIAGLATPFGVHLTTGALRAGAGDLALAATGAALMIINLLAGGIVYGILQAVNHIASTTGLLAVAARLPVGVIVALRCLQLVLFLVLLRFSPLTRVHAAEHMVVHAIEEGEDLTLEKVRAMARVHPRCGTNLMALLILLIIALQLFDSLGQRVDETASVLATFAIVVIVALTWRRLGAGLQRWVTTRPPSDRQLQRAIEVGESLLARIASRPSAPASVLRRIWNAGFLQVMTGFMVTFALAEYAVPWLAGL